MRFSLLALALLSTTAAAQAQTAAQALSLDSLKTVTQTLSSDAFEGRKPTSAGEDKTIAYLIERFQKAGLKPGNKGRWVQDVPLVELSVQAPSKLAFTGGKTPVSLAYGSEAVFSTYRVTPKIDLKDSEVVFVGYGINAPERGWNDYAGLDVKGKTVVILINDPDWQTMTLDGPFGGRAMTYYGRWTYKYEEAARQGAAGAIIIHDTEPAAYGWGVVESSWGGPKLEQDTPGDHADQSQLIGWIQQDAAKALFASAGKDYATLVEAARHKGFKAVPLGVKASASFGVGIKRQASKNVVGILPGTAKPDEVVLFSAHWDHLGHCKPVNGDDICNGAVDNATGTAGLVALAEANAKAGPAKRSMVFLAVTAEEQGLIGSQYYAEHPVYPLAKTVGGVNMDGLNIHGKAKDFVLVGAGKSELEELVKPLVAAEGRVIGVESTPEKGSYYRSDHFSFAKLGVPMLYGESGDDLMVGGKAAGAKAAEDYTDKRYHKPQDEYDPNWNWDGALSDLRIYYGLGRELAEGSSWPNWFKDAEFRTIRDKARAGQ